MSLNKDHDKLVEAARSGDEKSMAQLIDAVMPIVEAKVSGVQAFGSVTKYDLIQEGLLGFLNAVFSYKSGGNASFLTFASVCIQNSITSALRSHSRKKHKPLNSYVPLDELDSAEGHSAADPESFISTQESVAAILHCIKNDLSNLERNVLKLHMSGVSYEHIAQNLGVSVKSVGNALARARKKIKAASNI